MMTWFETIAVAESPAWLRSLLLVLLVATAAWLLRTIHLRLTATVHAGLQPLRVMAAAIHLPLLAILWTYGLAAATYLLVPPEAFTLRRTLYVGAHGLGAALAVWLLVRAGHQVFLYIDRWAARRTSFFDRYLTPMLARSAAALAPVLLLLSLVPVLTLSPDAARTFRNVTALLLIGGIAAVAIHIVSIGERFLTDRFLVDVPDNLRARRVHTQVAVLRKLITFVIVIVTLASMLMVFDKVRQLGTSILASAGIAGAIIGLASQKVLSNLIAGIQIALAQPIRLYDAVVVEGEWGEVEELTLTYVVVRIWDQRRLVLPITYFTEKPFQNWTRTSSDIIGTVYLYVDYSVPVDALRDELRRVVEASPRWDRRVCALQVTDLTERTAQIRILASARGADAFDLRCEIREEMMRFVQQHYPDALPRVRAQLEPEAVAGPPPSADTSRGRPDAGLSVRRSSAPYRRRPREQQAEQAENSGDRQRRE